MKRLVFLCVALGVTILAAVASAQQCANAPWRQTVAVVTDTGTSDGTRFIGGGTNTVSSGNGGGSSSPPPQPSAPLSKPNLTLDFDVLGPDGVERRAEHGALLIAGETVTLRVEVCNESKVDAADGRVKNGEKSDTRFWVRLPGHGDWTDIGREETRDSHLRAGACHVEKKTYRIPDAVGSTIGFRAKVDDRSEIAESREDDNTSRDEMFTIGAPPYCTTLGGIRDTITRLARERDANYAAERHWRNRENHYRDRERYNNDRAAHYDRKYEKYKKKYKKKKKSKYKRKYRKYRSERNKYRERAKRNREKYREADRKKNWHEAKKWELQREIDRLRADLARKERTCR